jgi:hypothetical protein
VPGHVKVSSNCHMASDGKMDSCVNLSRWPKTRGSAAPSRASDLLSRSSSLAQRRRVPLDLWGGSTLTVLRQDLNADGELALSMWLSLCFCCYGPQDRSASVLESRARRRLRRPRLTAVRSQRVSKAGRGPRRQPSPRPRGRPRPGAKRSGRESAEQPPRALSAASGWAALRAARGHGDDRPGKDESHHRGRRRPAGFAPPRNAPDWDESWERPPVWFLLG